MDIRKIRKLIEMLEESGLSEVEIHEGEESVRLSRYPQGMAMQPAPVAMPAMQPPVGQAPVAAYPAEEAAPSEEDLLPDGEVIRAPMVGTFYTAPSPGEEPYVRTSQKIGVGETLCIIEAMKMFNQVDSEFSGTVISILAENGQPVEFDQPLFVIRAE